MGVDIRDYISSNELPVLLVSRRIVSCEKSEYEIKLEIECFPGNVFIEISTSGHDSLVVVDITGKKT